MPILQSGLLLYEELPVVVKVRNPANKKKCRDDIESLRHWRVAAHSLIRPAGQFQVSELKGRGLFRSYIQEMMSTNGLSPSMSRSNIW